MKAPKASLLISLGYSAAAVFLSTAVLTVAYTQLHRIQATATRITRDTLPSIYMSGQLQSIVLHRYALLADYVDADEPKRTGLEREIESASARIDDIMHEYEALIDSPVDRRLFGDLKSARAPFDES